jgi:hypothetical protein
MSKFVSGQDQWTLDINFSTKTNMERKRREVLKEQCDSDGHNIDKPTM